jgi:Flp pilus assembly protein TadB
MADLTPVAPEALQRELVRERIQSARRINLVRLWGVAAFFGLFLVLGGILGLPAWTGNLHLLQPFDPQGLRTFVRALV